MRLPAPRWGTRRHAENSGGDAPGWDAHAPLGREDVSIRLEMLQVARVAPKVLGDAAELVRGFLLRQIADNGAFPDRTGKGDLYYTVFGLEGLLAVQARLPQDLLERLNGFLTRFGDGEGLDLVHLCCLVRCRATLAQLAKEAADRGSGLERFDSAWTDAVERRLTAHRASDGGYHPTPGAGFSTVYASFLALAACQDLRRLPPEPHRLAEAVLAMRTRDGGWANERPVPVGATNATAAAVTLLRNLSVPVDPGVGDWLMARRHDQGGFVAAAGAPIPDLLSTATALHALSGLQHGGVSEICESCLDYVDTLWTNEGAFHGHWDDSHLDVEYTYYGLLALGHLSL